MAGHREIDIDNVGIKNLAYPILLRDRRNEIQKTAATIDFYVDLPRQLRGTHMSRFVEVLNHFNGEIDIRNIDPILELAKEKLNAVTAHLKISFPYFIAKEAPVTKSKGLMNYTCTIEASSEENRGSKSTVTVRVPVTAVCPCSKENASHGAHNQRSIVKVKAGINSFVWLEELIEIVERSASCEIFSHLKREDEKFVTEKAYDNPAFVEDIVRNAAYEIQSDSRIDWFSVEAENFESIHNHNAYARITRNLKVERESEQGTDHSVARNSKTTD